MFAFNQDVVDAGDAISTGATGFQLFPGETASNFTFTAGRITPSVLFVAHGTTNAARSFGAGSLSIGGSINAPTDRGNWTVNSLAVTPASVYKWCATGTPDTCTFDAGVARNAAGVVEANNGTAGTLRSFKGAYIANNSMESLTAPTIASGGCTSPAVTSSNGTAAFLLTLGSSCTGVKTVVLTLPTATNFWACSAENNTSDAQQAANVVASRATSTTAVTLTNYSRTTGLQADYTAADTVLVKCTGE